ncbi:MAG: gliding motility-associated C-terminal domain-containing protein, partial [Bacteroidales bacterium]|nr:gliding motility-associated C-terminal domain-containing protein [Bacteroidales bacterium]
PTVLPVTVHPLPIPSLNGPAPVCEGTAGNVYTTDAGMSNYIWVVSAGGTITAGGGTNDDYVEVTWNAPGAQSVSVDYADANGCGATSPTILNVNVIAAPVVEAGPDTTICNGDDLPITHASVLNVIDFSWSSSGTGTFDDAGLINPTYTPSLVDRQNGSVTIYLDAIANAPCVNATDSFILTIPPPVQPVIGAAAPFLIGTDTEIEVCLATNGHMFIVDMGYYLIAPDGYTVFTLKKGPMEIDFFNPCVPFPPPPGDLDTLCFTTELPLTDTLDVCSEPRPIDGTFAATGDWSTLYGFNPAEGGWTVMIKDTANNMGGIDGEIVYASLSFTDTATATNQLTSVNYYSGSVNIPILEPAKTSYIIPRVLRESCPGACDAEGIVNVLGGVPPYIDYNWSPAPAGGNGRDTVLLCAGTYYLTVTDALGCTGTTSVEVVSPPEIFITDAEYTTDTLTCFGDSTGFISVEATGGTGNLIFTLLPSTPSETADSGYFSNLPAGTYVVRIEDAKGCYKDTSFTIYQHDQVLGHPLITHVTGDGYGSVEFSPTGGTPFTIGEGYRYSMDGGPLVTERVFDTLTVGTYDFHVEDSLGCPWDTTITIIVYDLDVDVIAADVLCYGEASGTISIWMNDGTPPYTVTINTTIFPNITVGFFTVDTLAAGDYDVRVEDDTGRRFDTTVTIHEAVPVNVTKSTNNPSCTEYNLDGSNASNGSISYFPSGGAGGFTYTWADTTLTTSSRSNLPAGTYTVTVQDANGCELVNTTILEGEVTIGAVMGITPIPNYDNADEVYWSDTTVCYMSKWYLRVYYQPDDIDSSVWAPEIYIDEEYSTEAEITARQEGQVVVYVYSGQCMDFDVLNISLFDTLNAHIRSDARRREGDVIYIPSGNPLGLWVEESYSEYSWANSSSNGTLSAISGPATTLITTDNDSVRFEGTTIYGCIEIDSVWVKIQLPIEVYDVFTPNNDGVNDYWEILHSEQYESIEVFIFDRWGQQIFHSSEYGTDTHNKFDGKSQKNGKDLPIGTYYYIIKPNDGEQGTFTGTVTIVR